MLIPLLFSCKKDPSEQIIIGDPSNMIINTYDIWVIRDIVKKSYELDVNNDGTMDYRFTSFNLTGPAMGCGPANGVGMNCLHTDALILGFLETDTMFRYITYDTLFHKTPVEIYMRVKKSCSRNGVNDSVVQIWDQHKASVCSPNEAIRLTDYFFCDSITLTRSGTGCMPGTISQTPDTVVYGQNIEYYNTCFSIVNDEDIYLGIKTDGRLGWIKLLISENYKIMLYESATEK